MRNGIAVLAASAALCSAACHAAAAGVNTDYITPPFTFSPDHRYGVMIPVFHIEPAQEPDDRVNKVVELRTRHIVAVIQGYPGYDRALNFPRDRSTTLVAGFFASALESEGKVEP